VRKTLSLTAESLARGEWVRKKKKRKPSSLPDGWKGERHRKKNPNHHSKGPGTQKMTKPHYQLNKKKVNDPQLTKGDKISTEERGLG